MNRYVELQKLEMCRMQQADILAIETGVSEKLLSQP